ncbi:MAG: hypothetical protein JRI34_07660 [Deltaproteobacteria bacterium]|nr:hypothetical protein [Deltaproteobacteria bacterium]
MIAPEALYFPYTDITKNRLDQALLLFKKIILYRLPEDQLEEYLSLAVERGLIQVDEVSFIEDRDEIRRILTEISRWVNQYSQPGSLSAIQQRALDAERDEVPSRLVSSIRHFDYSQASKRDPARDAQVFLHYARYLDQQAYEVNALMRDVSRKENKLEDLLGV